MEKICAVPIRNSIATKLLKATFSIYLAITITVTAIHMIVEYNQMKESVLNELVVIQNTFEPALSKAVWDLSHGQARSILEGMVKLPQVIGVRLENRNGIVMETVGSVSEEYGKGFVTPGGRSGLFQHQFVVTHMRAGKPMELGKATVYSSSGIVFQRVRVGFLFIAVNAVIKTIALWVLFLLIGRLLLVRPLSDLTTAVRKIDLDNLEHQKVDMGTTDPNELKMLEQAFNEMLEKLLSARNRLHKAQAELVSKERLAVLGHFAGSISHELRNPLSVIDSSVYFLNMKLDTSDEKIARHLGFISGNVKKSTAIIQSLLNLSRMETPKTEKIDLAELIFETLPGAKIPGTIEVVSNLPEEEFIVDIDREQIRMALKNVIKNAVQAMNDSGKLTIAAQSGESGQVELAITDTGPGISSEHLEKVFEPLFSTKTHGIGFGLSITKMIIENHGGKIRVSSIQGGGAVFLIGLPGKEKNDAP